MDNGDAQAARPSDGLAATPGVLGIARRNQGCPRLCEPSDLALEDYGSAALHATASQRCGAQRELAALVARPMRARRGAASAGEVRQVRCNAVSMNA